MISHWWCEYLDYFYEVVKLSRVSLNKWTVYTRALVDPCDYDCAHGCQGHGVAGMALLLEKSQSPFDTRYRDMCEIGWAHTLERGEAKYRKDKGSTLEISGLRKCLNCCIHSTTRLCCSRHIQLSTAWRRIYRPLCDFRNLPWHSTKLSGPDQIPHASTLITIAALTNVALRSQFLPLAVSIGSQTAAPSQCRHLRNMRNEHNICWAKSRFLESPHQTGM